MWKIFLWVKEAINGIFRNFTINIFATTLAFLSFFILSFWLIIGMSIQYTSDKIEENIQISMNLKDDVSDYKEIENDINELEGVKETFFISKEEAFGDMKEDLGERQEMLTELGFNPLPASFEIKVNDPEKVKLIAKKVESWGVTKSVKYGENYVDQLFKVTESFKQIAYLIMIIMIVSSGSMIYMSIRMNILNRNKELEIKNLIGAGKITIRVPFIFEGMIITVSSVVIMLGLIYFFYDKLVHKILEKYPGTGFVPTEEILTTLTPILFIIALVIGGVSSLLSTQKYLKRH